MLSVNTTAKLLRYCRWAALLAGFFVFYGCENDEKKIPNFNNKRTALEEGHKIESYLSQGGKTKAKLTAPHMYRYQGPDSSYIEFPNTLHVDFYNDTLHKESQVDAHYGKYREWENKVYLRDSVVAINLLNRDTLKTDELWWDQNAQKFYTHKPVHIYKGDGTIIHGLDGMEAPQNFSSYIIYKSSGRGIVPKEAQDTTPEAPKAVEDIKPDTSRQLLKKDTLKK